MNWNARKNVWRVAITFWWYTQKKKLGINGKVTEKALKQVFIVLAVRFIKKIQPDFFSAIVKSAFNKGEDTATTSYNDKLKETQRNKQKRLKNKRREFVNNRSLRDEVLKEGGFTCHYCGVFGANTIDHLIPLSRGGNNSRSNLVVACEECNMTKGNLKHTEILR